MFISLAVSVLSEHLSWALLSWAWAWGTESVDLCNFATPVLSEQSTVLPYLPY